MNSVQRAILFACLLLELAVLVGLALRGKVRRCHGFALYLAAVFCGDLATLFWTARFLAPAPWLAKEATIWVLRFVTAVELTAYTFDAFPVAYGRSRTFLTLIAVASLVALVPVPGELGNNAVLMGRVLPRLLYVTIWLFTGLGALVLWYRLPIDAMHKAILMGLVPYLLIFTVTLNFLDTSGWEAVHRLWAGYASSLAWAGVLTLWTVAAWRGRAAPPGQALLHGLP